MSVPKYQTFWLWLKITLYYLYVLLTILQLPSFAIGNDTFWLLRWQYQPGLNLQLPLIPYLYF